MSDGYARRTRDERLRDFNGCASAPGYLMIAIVGCLGLYHGESWLLSWCGGMFGQGRLYAFAGLLAVQFAVVAALCVYGPRRLSAFADWRYQRWLARRGAQFIAAGGTAAEFDAALVR